MLDLNPWNYAGKIFVLFFLIIGCADKELDPNDPVKSFSYAKEIYDDENYEMALTRLGEFKTRFPYSKLSVEAELLMANSHFELDQFPEASAAYTQFVRLHPKHQKVDFALFRIGQSFWEDAPEEIDREQEYTGLAIQEWQKLVAEYPASPYAKTAKENMKVGKRRIALANEFVASFYCKQEIWHACAYRYVEIFEKFKNYPDLSKKAGIQAADAFEKIAALKKAEPESDKNLYFRNMTYEQILATSQRLRIAAEKIHNRKE